MARNSFGAALRQAREQAGLSQATLARRAGMTAPYLSLLESGRRRPPAPPRVERLAKGLAQDPAPWLELAALERTPAPIRRRVEALDRERGHLGRARDRLLTTTLFRVARNPALLESVSDGAEGPLPFLDLLRRLAARLTGVRSVAEAHRRSDELLAPVSPEERERLVESLPDVLAGGGPGAPAATAVEVRDGLGPGARVLEELALAPAWVPPGGFLWRLAGDGAWPRLEAGDLLLIDPGRAPGVGDLVALRQGERDQVRRLERSPAGTVRLEALGGAEPPLRLAADAFAPCGVVVRLIRALA